MVKRLLAGLALFLAICGASTYQIIPLDNINSSSFVTVMTGLAFTPLTAAVGVQSQSVTFNGIARNTDDPAGWNILPGQNAQCPLISVRISSDNTFAFDFLNMAANACTPTQGTYVVLIVRVLR